MNIRISDRARTRIRVEDEWWRSNRSNAPELFKRELVEAFDRILRAPSIRPIYDHPTSFIDPSGFDGTCPDDWCPSPSYTDMSVYLIETQDYEYNPGAPELSYAGGQAYTGETGNWGNAGSYSSETFDSSVSAQDAYHAYTSPQSSGYDAFPSPIQPLALVGPQPVYSDAGPTNLKPNAYGDVSEWPGLAAYQHATENIGVAGPRNAYVQAATVGSLTTVAIAGSIVIGGIFSEAAAAEGAAAFSASEMAVINEARSISLAELRAAFQAGGAELNIAGRTIIVEPGMPASGMTLFGENGFVLGQEAFASDAELTKTLLHELYRLSTSQAAEGASGVLVTTETNAAFSFAARAFGEFF